MSAQIKTQPDKLEIVPSWTAAAQIAVLALEHGTPEGKAMARNELMRMAHLLDETKSPRTNEVAA
jgi:hypothetical protein